MAFVLFVGCGISAQAQFYQVIKDSILLEVFDEKSIIYPNEHDSPQSIVELAEALLSAESAAELHKLILTDEAHSNTDFSSSSPFFKFSNSSKINYDKIFMVPLFWVKFFQEEGPVVYYFRYLVKDENENILKNGWGRCMNTPEGFKLLYHMDPLAKSANSRKIRALIDLTKMVDPIKFSAFLRGQPTTDDEWNELIQVTHKPGGIDLNRLSDLYYEWRYRGKKDNPIDSLFN